MIGPALSLHENALRSELELLRFDGRLWVRVAIENLLAWNRPSKRLGKGRRSCCESLSANRSARP
jgi:hypothetical protein